MLGVRRFRLQAMLLLVVVGIGLTCVHATKPDGYMPPPRQPDPHPPKYEYGYAVDSDAHATANGTAHSGGGGQGHREFRDGDNTHGNYYVNFADGEAQQSVQYIADDWGYHPVVRYFSHNDHSQVSSHFALGESAVDRLRSERQQHTPLSPNHPQHTVGPIVQMIPMLHFIPPPSPPGKTPPAQHPPLHQQQPTPLPPLAGPLQYHPDQLQIIGVIPQEFPAALRLHSRPHSTVMYPVPEPAAAVQYLSPTAIRDGPVQTSATNALLEKTHSLINGYDVLDINHSAESVAQNTLFQAATADDDHYDAASPAQRSAVQQKESAVAGFSTPIVVDDQQQLHLQFPATTEGPEVSIKPGRARFSPELPKAPKQINLQIFDAHNAGQFLHEISTESSLTTQLRIPEAPSRLFLKSFQAPGKHTTLPATHGSSTPTTTTLSDGYETTTARAPQTIGVSKELNIKSLLERENDSNLVYGDRYFPRPSKTVHFQPDAVENAVEVSDEHITYVTTERQEHLPPATAGHRPDEPTVEIEQQVIVPFPTENNIEHSDGNGNAALHPALDQIVNEHIDCPPEPLQSNDVVERIVEKPVPFPYPVERIVEKEVPVPYVVEKIVDRPAPVESHVDVPVPVEKIIAKYIDRPVAIPHAVYVPVHVPYALDAHPHAIQFSHLPALQPNQYVPSYQPVKPLFYGKPVAEQQQHQQQHHPYFQQQHQHYHQPAIYQPAKPADGPRQVFLPHLHTLPAHLRHYHNAIGAKPVGPGTTHLHAARPYFPQQQQQQHQQHFVLPRPVYGVPQHYALASPSPHSPPALLANYHNHPGYAHSFGYAATPIVYRDEYRGPPPPLPVGAAAAAVPQSPHPLQFHQYPSQSPPSPTPPPPPQHPPHPQQYSHQSEWSAAVPRRPTANEDAGELVASASIQSPQILSPNALPSTVAATGTINEQRRRNLNFGKSMRWEDGFRPPLVPSVQTDEHGIPLDMAAN